MDQKEFEVMLADAEKKLDRLRASYELYFQGMEKLQPTIQLKALERTFYVMMREKPRSTNLRFRANQLLQKWSTYQMYWKRVTRQIEEGTYRKQVVRAKMKMNKRLAAEKRAEEAVQATDAADELVQAPTGKTDDGAWQIDPNANFELDMDEFEQELASQSKAKPVAEAQRGDDAEPTSQSAASAGGYRPPAPGALLGKRPAAPPAAAKAPTSPGTAAAPKAPAPPVPPRPAAPPAPRAAAAPRPPAPPRPAAPKPPVPAAARPPAPKPAASPADIDVKRVYERYVDARKKNNERVDNVKYEKVAQQIEKMLPDLKKKHQGKQIDFDIVLKDGKVGIKPVAK